jgi:tetratricopeptide (TPR) repeat protein
MLLRNRQFAVAAQSARDLTDRHPEEVRAWLVRAKVAAMSDDSRVLLDACSRARALYERDVETGLSIAQLLLRSGHHREALEEADRTSRLDGLSISHRDTLGTVFAFCGEAARSMSLFQDVCRQQPDSAAYLFNLATAQRMNGRLQEAESTLDRVIELRPDDAGALSMRSDLRAQSPTRNHVDALMSALGRARPASPEYIMLCYALGKELEDLGDHASSFQFLKRGADAHRSSLRYDVQDDVRGLQRLIDRHGESALLSAAPGQATEEPIFILGLPRSGTTLVERIVASHPDVYSAGELQAFPTAVRRLVKAHVGAVRSLTELIDRSLDIDPAELGAAYLEATRPRTGHTARFIDKLPTNYLNLLLIRRALPRARIIALRRDPVDSCYSMYKSYLTGPYRFTNDLTDLGRYYAAWRRLMSHWESLPGDAMLSVGYEELVAQPESTARSLIEHCRLAWDDRCLDFHAAPSPVATASASQVRRPIYSTSVGRWRSYRSELRPLLEVLRAEGISCEE